MHISETILNNIVVLAIEGRLDASNVPQLKAAIKNHLESGRVRFVADMRELRFIDSSGLGTLALALRQAMQMGGDIKISGLSPEMQLLFTLTRLNKVFEIHNSIESALAQ